ncbi:RNA-directed DNA polymerase [Bacillus anthracis]|uniref:RNA-directed DNA polymerase n=1 Tax=Bacillus anthracis TaxID=1392 RepID=UPI002DB97E19|nr:RNA-directed DNA polymerase [Bacillus anthracis]MEB9907528.1 RNA-directed DNA polymerase [Bacillus anthracis]MEC1954085.1 RNA-directed DNA polymerase [Bacillus anthracis]
MENNKISELTYRYILSMSKTKIFNPQTIANINILREYGLKGIKNEMEKSVGEFCETNPVKKARDFVYKNDYFTPRNMHLINPLYYTYYTYIVFKIADLFLNGNGKLNFSKERMDIFYSGFLDMHSKEDIPKNAKFNTSYRLFQEEREKYFGMPVLKVDIQDFFNSIKVKSLINRLRAYLGEQSVINDLEYFFDFCGFEYLPQFHYSMASSILSQFYLLDFDSKMHRTLERENLFLIRFVDDMFIVYLDGEMNEKRNNDLLNEISYFLWEEELVLNSSKTKLLSPQEYQDTFELMEMEYDFEEISYSSEKIIEDRTDEILEEGYLIILIEKLCELEESVGIDLNEYKELMREYISIDGEDTRKVLNNIIFSNKWKKLSKRDLKKIINNWRYILFNPAQFTILYILVCRHLENRNVISGSSIKEILNYLFRNKNFNFRDTLVAISYLFQNHKKNKELLNKVELVNPEYVDFIRSFI